MARYDTPGVFDVSPPSRTGADPYGRPVITGHQPLMNDPMMRGDQAAKVTNVPVTMDEPMMAASQPAIDQNPAYTTSEPYMDQPAQYQPQPEVYGDDGGQMAHPMPPQHEYKKRSFWRSPLMIFLYILIILFAIYSAVDAFTSVGLPFYIFRKKQAAVTQTPPPAPVRNTAPTVPAGFTQFTLTGTNLSFAYPTAWGAPTATTEPGFSSRGGANKSDGTYAYLINFATNKDVQIALTSAKYLPPARAALYYDYLQWCVGTNDNKYYKSMLRFSTADKVDTPATVTCDQGPLADATKLDDTTIVQLKTKSADGKTVIGDVYTKNLKATDVPVLRIKDATSVNGDNIKALLGTLQTGSSGQIIQAAQDSTDASQNNSTTPSQ